MRMIGGLTWPEDSNPGFLCIVIEKEPAKDASMEVPQLYYEVSDEFASHSLLEIFDHIKTLKHLGGIYTKNDTKYQNFIRDYAKYRRAEGISARLMLSQTTSFEAGIMKIKEFISKKLIIFHDDSTVKAQLKIFSKLSLKNEPEFYAVSALTQVVNSLQKRPASISEKEPPIKNWY